MNDLKQALLNAKYVDMISVADYVVRDCGLPDMDEDGNLMPQANEIAAALFRWAAGAQAMEALSDLPTEDDPSGAQDAPKDQSDLAETDKPCLAFEEYDENGDPLMDAETAEKLEAEIMAQAEETN